jgi:hypothetical protein
MLSQKNNPKIHHMVETILNQTNALLLSDPCTPGIKYIDRSWDSIGLNPAWKTADLHLVALSYGGISTNELSASKVCKAFMSETLSAVSLKKKLSNPERLRKRWAIMDEVIVLHAVSGNDAAYNNEVSLHLFKWTRKA